MQAEGSPHWRQSEWIGWYFQHECGKRLSDLLTIPGPRYGKVQFDAFQVIPWDFKAHVAKPTRDKCIVNDTAAVQAAVVAHGAVGVIIAVGVAQFDGDAGAFRLWHQEISGGESDYSRKRAERGRKPRRRKVAFDVRYFAILRLDEADIRAAGSFQKRFRNSDGSPRAAKVMLDLEKVPSRAVVRCFPLGQG